MIKLENAVLASPERNPMNSWKKSDSGRGCGSVKMKLF